MIDGDRYALPDFDPTGERGPRTIYEATIATQHRAMNGPARAGLPGYLAFEGGTWIPTEDDTGWRVATAEEQADEGRRWLGWDDGEGEDKR